MGCVGQSVWVRGTTHLDDVYGEGVKELVGDEHGEEVVAVGDLVEGVVPGDGGAAFEEGGALEGTHGGAGLDEMHAVEFATHGGELADDAEDVVHEGAASWAEFDYAKGF